MSNKTSSALSWDGLRILFPTTDSLKEAITSGAYRKLLEGSAAQFTDGDLYATLLQVSRNLSNIKCLQKTRVGTTDEDRARCALLIDAVQSIMSEGKATKIREAKASGQTTCGLERFWNKSLVEIEACEDAKELQSIYDTIASKRSKAPDQLVDAYFENPDSIDNPGQFANDKDEEIANDYMTVTTAGGHDYDDCLEALGAFRNRQVTARKRKATLTTTPVVVTPAIPETLATKLASGKSVTLSKSEIEALAKIFNK